ncbi:MAG TPA: PA2169 family four-helix-bundle protein [Vitreimonas sp.]|uniref:ferritin-like domain-containing protein n=1 Tax=Vitreimonas sp. TaxID=3069702 RepID=UPI002D5EB445|nr:PA2169 family four-helix-bundle protein [Vitreimonas sp.]HYD87215.1 PA2169 family four-helix-bundle protein [Vitreimonas sp.]
MPATTEHAVDVLNGLIKTTLDSVGGYEEAAQNADRSQYKNMFIERASKRRRLAQDLQSEVRSLGGEPETEQGALGKAHNKFVDIKNALTGGSDKAVIDEVERGEDHIKARFEKAMRDDDLPSNVRSAVTRFYQSVKADHDEVSRIKHTLH